MLTAGQGSGARMRPSLVTLIDTPDDTLAHEAAHGSRSAFAALLGVNMTVCTSCAGG